MSSEPVISKPGKQLYRLCLDDYSAASFTSFSKDYFGTLEDITSLINAIRSDKDFADRFPALISCFDRYVAGEKEITHNVAYREVPFLVRAKCLGVSTSYLKNHKWEHLNTWQWPYNMKCTEAKSTHIWISCRGTYARCVKTAFTNLEYENVMCKYVTPGITWGLPHQIETEGKTTFNRMFVVEKLFKNKAEALVDMQKFQIEADPDFAEVLNDIFGDG